MPIIKESTYKKRPRLYFNAWMETLIPYFTRKKYENLYTRERIELKDGDFLDLDRVNNHSDQLLIVSHGFEGNSQDHFILELIASLACFDIAVWHYRSCSDEMNRLPRFYHQGDIDDLDDVVTHAIKKKSYKKVFLIGFSMGGNLVINYLASKASVKKINAGIVFSTPMDLSASAANLKSGINRWVERSFLKKLKKKIVEKTSRFPNQFDISGLSKINHLDDLIEKYMLSALGFSKKEDFYQKWSSLQFLSKIEVPLLIVNAKNDPLLSENCYPCKECQESNFVYLETPKYGGHTGFTGKKDGELWYIWRIAEFLREAENL